MVENLCRICHHAAELLRPLAHQKKLHAYIYTLLTHLQEKREREGEEGRGEEGREGERGRGGGGRGGEGGRERERRGEGEMEVKAGNGYLTGYGLV